jgi:hypothetical protein
MRIKRCDDEMDEMDRECEVRNKFRARNQKKNEDDPIGARELGNIYGS